MTHRPAADGDRRRKLTEEGWEELRLSIETDMTKSVLQHCADAGVTPGRYYQRYPVRVGGSECDNLPPAGCDPGNTP